MSEPMTRTMAAQGPTKYSEYPAVSTVIVASGNEKISAAGGNMCGALREHKISHGAFRQLQRVRQ